MLDADVFASGGPIVYPLLFCSIIALTLFVERLFVLRIGRFVPHEQRLTVEHFVEQSDVEGLYKWLQSGGSPLKEMLLVLLRQWNSRQNRQETVARVEEWASQQANELERGLETMGVISSVAPMLGLMGTVLGMVVTFESIQTYGLGNADALAGGISQALLTTLVGLSVGVPTLIAHRFLLSRVDTILLQWQACASLVLDMLAEKSVLSSDTQDASRLEQAD